MKQRSASSSDAPALRADLQIVSLPGDRDCMVIDDIGGRFSRTKREVWAKARSWINDQPSDRESQAVWQQASAAGWTRARSSNRKRNWSPLSIKLPIASIDPIARRLVPSSDWAFSFRAILFWAMAGILGFGLLVVRWESWSGSVPTLAKYLASMNPIALAATFVLTKTVHELGHAVACRRIGSRCGVAGIWWLCLMPCPYVDVTEVWRQPSPLRRAAVMAAGIAAEGIVCVIALWVWLLSGSPSVQLAAMNVILICGVSTILFNANPLMRYDGYFVLSDLANSTNLRQEAVHAWHRLLTLPLVRWCGETRRVWSLVVYHFASSIYRLFIFIAIATMILSVADRWELWRVAAIVVALFAMRSVWGMMGSLWRVHRGSGKWSLVARHRRWFISLGSIALVGLILFVPLPRYRHVEGRLKAKDVDAMYLPGDGLVNEIHVQLGDRVVAGQSLASIRNPSLAMELAAVDGQSKVLAQRSRAVRLASLSGSSSSSASDHWNVLVEASRVAETRKQELLLENDRLEVRSPCDGIVLRGAPLKTVSGGVDMGVDIGVDEFQLSPGKGEPTVNDRQWCRIASTGQLQLTVPLNADDHEAIQVGTPLRFHLPGHGKLTVSKDDDASAFVHCTEVMAVSPIHTLEDEHTVTQVQTYQAIGDVPFDVSNDLDELVGLDGALCEVVVHLRWRALWKDLVAALRDVSGF